jgi:hypothetical protein
LYEHGSSKRKYTCEVPYDVSAIISREQFTDNFNSSKMQRMLELLPVPTAHSSWIVSPRSTLHRMWDAATILFSVYYLFFVPLFPLFPEQLAGFVITTDIIACTFFLADVYLRLYHFGCIVGSQVVMVSRDIYDHYMQNSFSSDVLDSIPLSLLVYAGMKQRGEEFSPD